MTRLISVALSLLLSLPLLSSCIGSGSGTPSGAFAVKGFVIADEPVVGAAVSLVDAGGNVIASTTSRPGGVFVITADHVPAGSTITARDGTYLGAEFRG